MSTREKRRPGRPSRYPPEFRHDAVAMVLDQERPIAEVARSPGVNECALGNWVARERRDRTDLAPDERAELAESRSEVAELRMKRDLLKRSLAFWVKGSRSPLRARPRECPRRATTTGSTAGTGHPCPSSSTRQNSPSGSGSSSTAPRAPTACRGSTGHCATPAWS